MELFYGVVEKSDLLIDPEDTDEFYDLEIEHGAGFVRVDGQLYKFWPVEELDSHGFSLVLPPGGQTRVLCYWYNGGAGIHEAVAWAIEKGLSAGQIIGPDIYQAPEEVVAYSQHQKSCSHQKAPVDVCGCLVSNLMDEIKKLNRKLGEKSDAEKT